MNDDKPKARPNPHARLWVQDLRGQTDEPAFQVDESGEPWVKGRPTIAQRVPGIDEAQEATYVDPEHPEQPRWWRAALIGTAVGLAATAIFAAIMLSSDSDGDSDDAVVGAVKTATSSTTRRSTTTTSATTVPPSTAPATPSTTAAPASVVAAAVTPTPRATSDPALAPYTQVPLPNDVGATMSNCAWQPTNGGQYEAAGTVTNGPSTNHGWTLTIHWLQNDREIATQSALVDLTAGQSSTWNLTLAAPNPPADPFSCALTAVAA